MTSLPSYSQISADRGAAVYVFSMPHCELAEVRVAIPLLRESDSDVASAAVLSDTVLQPTLSSQRDHRDRLLRGGAEFNVSLMPDKLFVSGLCPPDSIPDCLSVVFQACADVPADADFVNLLQAAQVRVQMLAGVPESALRSENLRRRWGRQHPFARETATVEALQRLTHSDYAAFVTERLGIADAQIVVATDATDDEQRLGDLAYGIAEGLGSLPAHNRRGYSGMDVPPVTPGIYQLPGGDTDAVISMQLMTPAAPRTASDHAAFRTATTILGGYPNSRLLVQLRDRLGIVYQISSHMDDYRGAASLTVSLKTPQHLCQETTERFIEILVDFVNRGPRREEIDDAVRFLVNSTDVSWANPAGFSSAQAVLLSTGAGLDYWGRLTSDLAELSADDIVRAAQRYLAENVCILGIS